MSDQPSPAPVSPRGLRASAVVLPAGAWRTLLDFLCERFANIERGIWVDRFARGRVLDESGTPLDVAQEYRAGTRIRYFREVDAEPSVPFPEIILHIDEDLVVVDKPHFLPVMPSGPYVEETLQARLVRRLGNPQLTPLHRIDRLTAGLVLFSSSAVTRSAYQRLFAERRIEKFYEAIAPALPLGGFPLRRATRLTADEQVFFRMCEAAGDANSETAIDVRERGGKFWRYALQPVTGRKHQLRVHMAGLGAPICNDPWYPTLSAQAPDDYRRPLQLLAKGLAFIDPVSGRPRYFESGRKLDFAACRCID
jgi:tRNA pseudouridine32 synthase / 23S rRNA pseudouridine746 synthase